MRTRTAILLALLLAALAAAVPAQPRPALPLAPGERQSRWSEAARAYRAGEYRQALENWREISERGRAHPDLYYNMGNAWYQLGEHGRAAWMYEKALKLDPRLGDARHNLELVRGGKTPDDASTGSFLLLPFAWFGRLLTVGEWAVLAALLWWLGALTLALAIASRRPRLRRIAGRTAIVAGLLLAVSLAFFLPRLYHTEGVRYGIVLDDGAVVRAGPSEREPAYFEAAEGDRVEVSNTPVRDWVRVKRPADGRVGYLPESAVGRI